MAVISVSITVLVFSWNYASDNEARQEKLNMLIGSMLTCVVLVMVLAPLIKMGFK
jgi:hypothetical protein